jgi:hypothetical protein
MEQYIYQVLTKKGNHISNNDRYNDTLLVQ